MATLTPSSEDTRIYEFCVLYPHPYGQKDEQELLMEIERIFEEAGGKMVSKDMWGRRGLAYSIGGYAEGNFVVYYYDLDPVKLREIDQALRILKGLLRHMIVKPPKKYQIVSYADKYLKWLEDEKQAEERAVTEREDKLRKQVVDKATRRKPVVKKVEPEAPAKPVTEEVLTKEIDKMISDDSLNI